MKSVGRLGGLSRSRSKRFLDRNDESMGALDATCTSIYGVVLFQYCMVNVRVMVDVSTIKIGKPPSR